MFSAAEPKTLNVYRSANLTLDEFEGPRYQRISHIKKILADRILGEICVRSSCQNPRSPGRRYEA